MKMAAIAEWEMQEQQAIDALEQEMLRRNRKAGFENGRRLSGHRAPFDKHLADIEYYIPHLAQPSFMGITMRRRGLVYIQGFIEGWEEEPRPWVAVETWKG